MALRVEELTHVVGANDDIQFAVRGRVGHITLNRPRILNALSHDMILRLHAALTAWAGDDDVAAVLIIGAGSRGLCAGGDIVALYPDAVAGDDTAPAAYWRDEYLLNGCIARYPKPYVAIMDGIVLGGGIGVSAHGSHRIVTDRSRLGMPETGIGFVPDVGGSWLLANAPGEIGTMLALSAGTVLAADAIALGFADTFVASDSLPALVAAIEAEAVDAATLDTVIARFAGDPGSAELLAQRGWIDAAFAGNDLGAILARVQASGEVGASAAEALARNSPTAMSVALAAVRRAARLSVIEEALDQEYRVSLRAFAAPDFAEGVRAKVIEKDQDPHWQPARVEAVDAEGLEAYFASLGRRELGLSAATAPAPPVTTKG
ncbi:MAG: enoyl-CoA hydratase/isomerase family protein [Microbacteriaceae bacterium]